MDTAVLALRTVLALVVVIGLVVVLGRVLDDRASGRSQDGFVARLVAPLRALVPGASRRPAAPRRRRPAAVIGLVGRQALGPKASVAVVDVGAQRLVLGVSEAGVTLLTTMDAPVPEPEPEELPATVSLTKAPQQVSATPAAATPSPAFDEVFAGIVGASETTGASTTTDAAATTTAPAATVDPALVPGRSAVDGSILSPATWRQAVSAVQTRARR
ncbi:flagellar biogenesis protein [Sanguibacter keddieii DSM 10542]|uniref:Flagellar biogenesis protein n=1 Tax=Sanguibacter keddieii (strain ATCC 51767 / DSM 10542 / NCFB 3025 / ST-74) TaxID=446469 RepID=D1BCL7_SANKS|nr:flagellar biosynthetic protein FliO [Sanguibacter keddieii]ACZ23004.1 flagellar biogenesis protein [Sanguibacter keddieii DSM 10542]